MAALTSKPITQVSSNDFIEFCRLELEEDVRLDYKLMPPTDLEKTIAAFANTLGGCILLGVRSDKTNNRPILDSSRLPAGMQKTPGVLERIAQKAHHAIYPPVAIEISSVLDHPNDHDKCFVLVRVPESREAPHAVCDRRIVYERVISTTDGYDLANIDRIEHLINRRRGLEERRIQIQGRVLSRAARLFKTTPYLAVIVSPMYPWRPLLSREETDALFEATMNRPVPVHSCASPDGFWGHYRYSNNYGEVYCEVQRAGVASRVHTHIKKHDLSVWGSWIWHTLAASAHIFRRAGYWGFAEVRIHVANCFELKLSTGEGIPGFLDEACDVYQGFLVSETEPEWRATFAATFRELASAFGCEVSESRALSLIDTTRWHREFHYVQFPT